MGMGEVEANSSRRTRPTALTVEGVDFHYGPLQILFDVNLHVEEGEVLALLGTNGAGKSTVLKVISGLCTPDAGSVRRAQRDITRLSPVDRVRAGIVQVPGGAAVFPDLSVEDNLRLGGFLVRKEAKLLAGRTEEVLELFPALRTRFHQRAGVLSGGEQQMLALAKGLLLDPKVLLIDELSMGLAPIVVEQLLGVVRQLRARGTTMIIVEQSLNVALALAERAVFMEKGHVIFEGRAQDLLERDDVVRAVFFGSDR